MELLSYFNTEAQAYIAKGMLESRGIPAVVQSDALATVFPAGGAGSTSIGLYVSQPDLSRARTLLEHHLPEDPNEPLGTVTR